MTDDLKNEMVTKAYKLLYETLEANSIPPPIAIQATLNILLSLAMGYRLTIPQLESVFKDCIDLYKKQLEKI